jgi:hypothetical protein
MTRKNAWLEIRKRLNPEVFRPFWIVLKNGEVLHVRRKFQAAVSPDGMLGDVADPERHAIEFAMKDVVAVEDKQPVKADHGRGTRRGRDGRAAA